MPIIKYKLYLVLLAFIMVSDAYADNRFSVAPGLMYFDYEERGDDGSFLDGETGPVFGATVTLERNINYKDTAVLYGGIYTGTVDYDGHTQSGIPIQTDTKANFYTLGAAAQVPVEGQGNTLSVIIGYRLKRWERDIQSVGFVSGLYEIYQWQEFNLGAQYTLKQPDNTDWRFFAGLFRTQNANIKIDLSPQGYGKPELSLGTDTGLELSIQWMKVRPNNRDLAVKLSYKAWEFGRSPNELSSGPSGTVIVHEPKSETSTIMLELVISSSN